MTRPNRWSAKAGKRGEGEKGRGSGEEVEEWLKGKEGGKKGGGGRRGRRSRRGEEEGGKKGGEVVGRK